MIDWGVVGCAHGAWASRDQFSVWVTQSPALHFSVMLVFKSKEQVNFLEEGSETVKVVQHLVV